MDAQPMPAAKMPQTPPEADSPTPTKSRLSMKPVYLTLTLIAGVLIGAGGLFVYQEISSPAPITSFEECIKANGNQTTLMYPGTCTTRDGKTFTQPVTVMPTPPSDNSEVIGINLNSCCQCPELIPQSQIGTDGWEIYNPQKDYGNERPPYCDAAGVCAPCPPLPTPSCSPRPKCLDMEPRCMIPETEDMCPPDSPPSSGAYTCPKGGWENCMPILTPDAKTQCSKEALDWKKQNCPGFQGAAY